MAKIGAVCDVCGRMAKREPRKAGYNLCKLHYQIRLREEAKKDETTHPTHS